MTGVSKDTKRAALQRGLSGLFKALQARPVPDRLRSVVDQLDEGEVEPAAEAKAAERR